MITKYVVNEQSDRMAKHDQEFNIVLAWTVIVTLSIATLACLIFISVYAA